MIWWSLLGSYVCFITTSSATVEIYFYYTTCWYQTTVLCQHWLILTITLFSSHCTVQYLKYLPVISIIGWQFWEPNWVSVTFHVAPASMFLKLLLQRHTHAHKCMSWQLHISSPDLSKHTTEKALELCKMVNALIQKNYNAIYCRSKIPNNDTFITGFVGSNVDALKFSSSRSEYQKIVHGSLEEAETSSSSDPETESESESSSGFTFSQANTTCRSEYVLRKSKSGHPLIFSFLVLQLEDLEVRR